MKYILDTNTVIYYLDGILPVDGFTLVLDALQNRECAISVITKIETLGFEFPNADAEEKAKLFVLSLPTVQLSEEITNQTIEIRKSRKIKVADGIIAATAITYGLTLISRNEKDFKNLPRLTLVNPFNL